MSRVLGRAYTPDTSNRQAQREAERFNLTLGQALKSFHTQVLWAREAPQTAFAPDAGPSAWSFQALAKHEPNVNRDTRAYCAAIRETAQNLCAAPPLRPVVLHGDLHIGNVLVHEDGVVSGFVDVEKMCWGRPEQDLIFMGGLPHHFPAILQHYQTASPQVPFDENIAFALAAAHFLAVGLAIQSQQILSENEIRESKKCLRTAVHLTRQLAERSGRFRSLSCAARACCF